MIIFWRLNSLLFYKKILMSQRVLASVQTIKSVEAIPGADAIVKVTFESIFWCCVMKVSEAVPGARIIYFEIDSLLPKTMPQFEFMSARNWKVKTIKLRGQISQGLAMPICAFADILNEDELRGVEDGFDLTTKLNITKYEPPEDVASQNPSSFPHFIRKTDEPRVQNMLKQLSKILATLDLHATVKLDGSSATYYYKDGVFGVCSRNLQLNPEKDGVSPFETGFYDMSRRYGIEAKLLQLKRNIAIQGEIVGPDYNGNRCKLNNVDFYIFTAQLLDEGRRLTLYELVELVKELNSQAVPQWTGRVPTKI